MTEREKATGILKHYFKLRYNIDQFTIFEINEDTIYLSLIVNSLNFHNYDLKIIDVNFLDSKILGSIDKGKAWEYVKANINDLELFE